MTARHSRIAKSLELGVQDALDALRRTPTDSLEEGRRQLEQVL